jgi:hypothetical protein
MYPSEQTQADIDEAAVAPAVMEKGGQLVQAALLVSFLYVLAGHAEQAAPVCV